MIMYDIYKHSLYLNGIFAAGYNPKNIIRAPLPYMLFTTLRIIRVLDGSADWKIGERVWHIEQGDIVIVNNVELRQFIAVDPVRMFTYENFAFLPTIFAGDSSCLCLFYSRSPEFCPIFRRDMPYYCEINTLLDMLGNTFCSSSELQRHELICGLLTSCTAMIIRAYEMICPGILSKFEQTSQYSAVIVERAIRYINRNISNEFTVSELAKHLNLSRSHFSTVFTQYTGITPSNFINKSKISNVLRLIKGSDISILDAINSSGFRSTSGFYKSFRSICGCSPHEYMRNNVQSDSFHK